MALIWPILNSLIMIFILIVPGLFFQKRELLTEHQNDAISSIVVNLTWPCLVIDAMQLEFSIQTLKDTGYISAMATVIFAVLILISVPLAKLLRMSKTKQYVTIFMMLFGNTGFIGIPVIKALYGTNAIFFAAIVELMNDVFLFTLGIVLIQLSAGARLKINLRQFLNPGLIGVIIGLGLFLLNIQLPELFSGCIEMIGNATTPLTMFVIGFQLGGLKLKEIAGDWKVYAVCFIKLLIVPVAALVVAKLWAGDLTLLEKVLVVSFAMPVASVSAIFSQQYKGEAAFATKTVLLSTVFSIITIPIFAIILEL
ncbi:MAG: AEC family transporter [Firmicutes bacterium]|jgi:predicted permease|nr:AEC family transporter [Bacillota bacterium]NBI62603.1 AEC family transporter [Clostridiales bacterium]